MDGSGGLAAFPRERKELLCGHFRLQELAERFGTPLYVYSMDFIRNRFREVEEAFAAANPTIAYSVKANGSLALLNRLSALGSGADIVSGGELFRALRAGITPGKILFAGVGKADEELKAGLAATQPAAESMRDISSNIVSAGIGSISSPP